MRIILLSSFLVHVVKMRSVMFPLLPNARFVTSQSGETDAALRPLPLYVDSHRTLEEKL